LPEGAAEEHGREKGESHGQEKMLPLSQTEVGQRGEEQPRQGQKGLPPNRPPLATKGSSEGQNEENQATEEEVKGNNEMGGLRRSDATLSQCRQGEGCGG